MATTTLNGRNCTTKTATVRVGSNSIVMAVEELLYKKGQHPYFSAVRFKSALCLGTFTAAAYCASKRGNNVFVRHPANTNLFEEIMQGNHATGVRVSRPNKIHVSGNQIARAVEALRATYQGYIDAQNKKFGRNSRFKNIPCSMATNFCYAILHVIRHGLNTSTARSMFRMGFNNHKYIMKAVTRLTTATSLKKAIRSGANSVRK